MKIRWKKIFAGSLALVFFVSGCSKPPSAIKASYVSSLKYESSSCDQLKQEIVKVEDKISDLSKAQEAEANKDAVMMGIALLLFWPALFFLMGTDNEAELARLKGEYETLESVAIEKQCDYAVPMREARLKREEERKKAEEEMAKMTGKGVR